MVTFAAVSGGAKLVALSSFVDCVSVLSTFASLAWLVVAKVSLLVASVVRSVACVLCLAAGLSKCLRLQVFVD